MGRDPSWHEVGALLMRKHLVTDDVVIYVDDHAGRTVFRFSSRTGRVLGYISEWQETMSRSVQRIFERHGEQIGRRAAETLRAVATATEDELVWQGRTDEGMIR